MPRYKLTLEYLGTGFAGWQRVQDRPSIQASLEEAAFKLCGERVEVIGAGRTDAGVHASAQVAHVDLPKEFESFNVMQGLNFHLLTDAMGLQLAVTEAERVTEDFHARFSATGRRYVYRMLNRRARPGLEGGRVWHVVEPMDAQAMHAAAQRLIGHHDFSSFRDTQCQAKSPLKTLDRLAVERIDDEIRIYAEARSFLHHQVRILTGTLWKVGRGDWSAEDMKRVLEAKDRREAGPTAPAEGLYLINVIY